MFLTYADVLIKTGLTPIGVNITYVNNKLKIYSHQISQMTFQNFDQSVISDTQIFNLLKISQDRITIGGWQKLNLLVQAKFDTTTQNLIEGKDFQYIYPVFQSYQNDSKITQPVIGLDFKCLSYTSECDKIVITGDHRFSVGIPDDLLDILTELVTLILKYDSNAYNSGILPQSSLINLVTSENDQTRSVSWHNQSSITLENQAKISEGLKNKNYTSTILKYARCNLKTSMKLYA